MKKIVVLIVAALSAVSLAALPGRGGDRGISPQEILAAAPGVADKSPDQVTVGERLALASALSVAMQKQMYEHRAAAASFVLPGMGQILTGDFGSAALHMGAQAAIVGGGIAAMYFLAPRDLLDFSKTREQRRDAMRAYMTPSRIGEILPAMGVAAGTMALSLINSFLASDGARNRAAANIESGAVVFEPRLSMMGGGLGLGMRFPLR